jgi:hypothetical protein
LGNPAVTWLSPGIVARTQGIVRVKNKSFWWVGFAAILFVAIAMRLAIYDFSLPYIDHPDEPTLYLGGQEWRGLFDLRGEMDGYPPGYIVVNIIVQKAAEPLGIVGPSAIIRILRLIAAAMNVLTLALIMLTAAAVGGEVAALAAGVIWTIAPVVLQYGVYAVADPFVYFFVALALYLAVVALITPTRRAWSVWSVMAGLLATLFKYPAIAATLPGLLVGLNSLIMRKRGRDLGIQVALIGLVGGWLVFGYQAQRFSSREASVAKLQGIHHLLDMAQLAQTLRDMSSLVITLPMLVLLGAGLFTYGLVRYRTRIKFAAVGLIILIIVTIPWLSDTFNTSGNFRVKDLLPASDAVCVLLGYAVALLSAAARSLRLPTPARVVGASLIAVASVAIAIPQIDSALALMADLRRPDRRVDLRNWADASLEPGTFIVSEENHKTFNPYYGGLTGHKRFDWWVSQNFLDYTVSEWRDVRGMSYIAFSPSDLDALKQSAAGQAALAQMLHLRDFVAPPDERGPETSVYRLWGIQNPTQAQFENTIRLLGYDGLVNSVVPGQNLHLRYYWQALQPPKINYSVFTHILDKDGHLIAQADGSPAGADRPTSSWDDPGETLIGTQFDIQIPGATPPGTYIVNIGLYDSATGARLSLPSGPDSLSLLTFTIP